MATAAHERWSTLQGECSRLTKQPATSLPLPDAYTLQMPASTDFKTITLQLTGPPHLTEHTLVFSLLTVSKCKPIVDNEHTCNITASNPPVQPSTENTQYPCQFTFHPHTEASTPHSTMAILQVHPNGNPMGILPVPVTQMWLQQWATDLGITQTRQQGGPPINTQYDQHYCFPAAVLQKGRVPKSKPAQLITGDSNPTYQSWVPADLADVTCTGFPEHHMGTGSPGLQLLIRSPVGSWPRDGLGHAVTE